MGGASSVNEEEDMIPMVINGNVVEKDSRNGMFLKERGILVQDRSPQQYQSLPQIK
jgi:hypothetical protein